MTFITDAASTIGYGGFFQGRWFHALWPPDMVNISNKRLSMAYMELYPIVVAAMLWGKLWTGKRILLHCDNTATVHIINKGRSKSSAIMLLMRRLTWCQATCNFMAYSVHIEGYRNNIADSLSRFQMQRFWSLAPLAERTSTPCPQHSEIIFP